MKSRLKVFGGKIIAISAGIAVIILLLFLNYSIFEVFGPLIGLGTISARSGSFIRSDLGVLLGTILVNILIPLSGGVVTGWFSKKDGVKTSLIMLIFFIPMFLIAIMFSVIDVPPPFWSGPEGTFVFWLVLIPLGGYIGEKLYSRKSLVRI